MSKLFFFLFFLFKKICKKINKNVTKMPIVISAIFCNIGQQQDVNNCFGPYFNSGWSSDIVFVSPFYFVAMLGTLLIILVFILMIPRILLFFIGHFCPWKHDKKSRMFVLIYRELVFSQQAAKQSIEKSFFKLLKRYF